MKVELTRQQIEQLIEAAEYALETAHVEGGDWGSKPEREIGTLRRAIETLRGKPGPPRAGEE